MISPLVSRRHGHGCPTAEGRRTQGANECTLATRFFCNGDQFYPGQRVYVSRKRYPTLDRLLVDLSRMLAGAVHLPYGVRQLYGAEDGRRVESLDDVVDDEKRNFVCAGLETFRPLQYGQKYAERWCVGKPTTNSLSPRDIVFRKNAKSCASLDAVETEGASAVAKSVGEKLDTSTGTSPRSTPKPAKFYRSENVTTVDTGETVTLGRQPKGEDTRVRSEASKVVNLDGNHQSARRKVNYSVASLPTTRTKWPQSRRTSELFERSGRTLAPCGSLRKSGGTRKSQEIISTWRKTADICDSFRIIARSTKVLEIKSDNRENVERLRNIKSQPSTANTPADSVKTAEITASSRATSLSSRATPVSSREISISFREIPVGSRATTVTSRENHVTSKEISNAMETSETAGSCKHAAAVPLNSDGKRAVSAKSRTEFSSYHLSLDCTGAFPQTSRQSELQVAPKIQLGDENDQNEIHPTKAIRSFSKKASEQSQTNANIKSADPEQLRSRKKGSKSRNRETPLKSQRSIDRFIVESGILAERFQVGEVLGEGNFAVVKRCQARATQAEYAMKVISKSKVKGKEEVVENELLILRRCRHPNVVRLIESYETKTEVYIVMELVEGGDLFEAIRRRQRFPEVEASSMVKDMAKALQYLHLKNIVHRDVKPENLLIQRKNDGSVKRLKLADFGLAVVTTGLLFKLCGTPTYVAPEILSDIGYGSEVDMWSVGVILYILLSGYPPFRSSRHSDSELFDLIQLGHFVFGSPQWDHISDGAQDLIRRLLEVNVRKRLRAEEVLRHPWIRSSTTDPSTVSTE